ncbi:hypothetical protein [Duganella caerulea]|uniref:hypothetical protein n=1 Tax=Duganella caerulea TaxID=2885762 RepID=UPI0040384F27
MDGVFRSACASNHTTHASGRWRATTGSVASEAAQRLDAVSGFARRASTWSSCAANARKAGMAASNSARQPRFNAGAGVPTTTTPAPRRSDSTAASDFAPGIARLLWSPTRP